MAWNPNQQRKFVSRKFRLALDENYHLDKIRGEKKERKKLTLNVWTALAISVVILILAFVLPRMAKAVVLRRHTDALVDLNKTMDAILQTEMQKPGNDTVFVVEEGGRYFLFWYCDGANSLKKDDEKDNTVYYNLVEISNPGDSIMPINVKKGKTVTYPFNSSPVTDKGDNINLTDDLQLLTGCRIVKYDVNDELQKVLKKNVKLYKVVGK